jgi:predicted secreted hydrolase
MSKGWMILIVLWAALAGCAPRPTQQPTAQISGLPAAAGSFQRAVGERVFIFPGDHGAHPAFQTEWWYYTGNLHTPDGRQFGFQLTFFRRALPPDPAGTARASDWAAGQVYLAHFALADVQGKSFRYFERFSRGAAGLAGAVGLPAYQVWLDNWSVAQSGEGSYRLKAAAEDITLDLALDDRKGPVLQGVNGYSQKGAEPGNASYYYSQTRLVSSGRLALGGQSYSVDGLSWMDHEFFTSALAKEQVGWSWFSMQLDDGSELMVYTLRRADGSADPFSSGTLVRKDGSTRRLARDDFKITETQTWRSPHSGVVYPAGWVVEVGGEELRLEIRPLLADQELRVSFTYWEGAVQIVGERAGQAVKGGGYVELTGYAQSMQGQF